MCLQPLRAPIISTAIISDYYSSVNVLKGDHIRLQEINLGYSFPVKKRAVSRAVAVCEYQQSRHHLERRTIRGVDPEVYDFPIPRNYSIGFFC